MWRHIDVQAAEEEVETNPFHELVVIFTDYALQISLGTFSILPTNIKNMKVISEIWI